MKSSVGVCVIGCGRAGLVHARNFRTSVPHARLAALADPNETAAKQAAKELEVEAWYTDYRAALQNPQVDAVVIATPPISHKEIAVAAAEAGKHILCEKPMAMSEAECDEMIAAAERAGVKLQIAFMRRFDESFLAAKEAVDAGEIGEVVLIKSLTRGPSVPQPWMYDLKRSNGPLAEVNSHDIDTLRWFAGSEIASVFAVGGNFRCPDAAAEYPDFYDNVILAARFRDGKQGLIDGALFVKYGYDARVEILGSEGVILIGDIREKRLVIGNSARGLRQPAVSGWRSLYKDAYLAEDAHFVQCILEDAEPRVTGYDGKMAVRVVEAGNRSIREQCVVHL